MITQEEKQLLLVDLCARLPYGVKVYAGEDLAMTLKQIDYKGFCESWENEDFKCHSRWMIPYLRPMFSITGEEVGEFESITEELLEHGTSEEIWDTVIDWLNAHHFDHRHLIEKGLALEAPEGMYKTE